MATAWYGSSIEWPSSLTISGNQGQAEIAAEGGTGRRAILHWPHPYHGSDAHRRANRRSRSSHDTVGAAVMGSVADRLGGTRLERLRTSSVNGLRATSSTAFALPTRRGRSRGRTRG